MFDFLRWGLIVFQMHGLDSYQWGAEKLNSAIPFVTSGLTLVAFLAATFAFVWRSSIRSAEKRIEAAPAEDRQRVIEAVAEWIGVDIKDIPHTQRTQIVLRQLEIKSDRQKQIFRLAIIIAVLFFTLSVIAIVDSKWNFKVQQADVPTELSKFTLNTPPELVKSVMGIPTAIRGTEEEGTVFYTNDELGFYVGDYRESNRRIGLLFLSLDTPLAPFPLSKPIQEFSLQETIDLCGPLEEITAHLNIYSAICGGSEAQGGQYYRLFFSLAYRTDEAPSEVSGHDYQDEGQCAIWRIKSGFDLEKCPYFAKWPAIAVAISNNADDLKNISVDILEDFDFNKLFT